MPLLPRLASLWRNLFHKDRMERELTEEIRAHLEMLIELKIQEGLDPAEARRAALIEMDGEEQVKERVRDVRMGQQLDTLLQDLRYGARMLFKNPGFALIGIFTLALGIGANTAIFSVMNAVLLRSLPYRDSDKLVLVSHYRAIYEIDSTSGADFLEWRDQAKAFELIAAYMTDPADLTGSGEPERLTAAHVSADLFRTLGIAPALGRAFTSAEYTDGGELVVILSEGLWRRRFGGDPHGMGRELTLEGQSRTIIGIMPPGFRFPEESDLWVPLAFNLGHLRMIRPSVIARLKSGVTPEVARADLSAILKRQRQASPED